MGIPNKKLSFSLICIIVFLTLVGTVSADTEGPSVTSQGPVDNYVSFYNRTNFSYIATDAGDILWCKLWANNSYTLNSTINNATTNNINNVYLTNGTYAWKVQCMDNATNTGNSTSRTLTVVWDVDMPTVQTNTTSATVNSSGTATFNYVPRDNESGLSSCKLIVNNAVEKTAYSITNNTNNSFSLQFGTGTYFWRVNCSDWNNNEASSALQALFVENIEVPVIAIMSPENNTEDTDGKVEFAYTPVAENSINWCELILNQEINQTDNSITNNSESSFPVVELANGSWSWTVNCTDSEGREGSSGNVNLSVNLLKLESSYVLVNLLKPNSGATATGGKATFKYKVEALLDIEKCDLITNNSVRQTHSSVTKDLTNIFSDVELSGGTWDWTVKCTNSINNTHQPSSRSLVVLEAEGSDEPPLPPQISTDIPELEDEEVLPPTERPSDTWISVVLIVTAFGSFLTYLLTNEKYWNKIKYFFKPVKIEPKAKAKLMSYVKKHSTKGYSHEKLREHLLNYGWRPEHVDLVFGEIQEEKAKIEKEKGSKK